MRLKGGISALVLALGIAGQFVFAAVPVCDPKPNPVKMDVSPPDRESIAPHQGDLVVEVTISVTGEIVDARIVSSTDNWFDQSVLASARAWRFSPLNQICRYQFPVHFQLRHEQ
jgi:TonB family protein